MDSEAVVAQVAEYLEAPVVLVDRSFSLIAHSAQTPGVDHARVHSILTRSCPPGARAYYEQFGIASSTVPVRTPEFAHIGASSRICIPVRYAGSTFGYCFVLAENDRLISDADLSVAMELAARAARELAHSVHNQHRLAVAVTDLLEGDRTTAEAAASSLVETGLVPDGTSIFVLAVDGLISGLRPRTLLAPVGALTAVIVPNVEGASNPLHTIVDSGSAAGPLIGIGDLCSELRGARRSWKQAKICISAARLDRSLAPVARWSDLGVYRLAECEPRSVLRDAVLTTAVMALLDSRHVDLLATAQSYLANAGDVAATAAAIGIHRQTLYYRIGKVQELTGLDLTHGPDRLELHVGITLGRLLLASDEDSR